MGRFSRAELEAALEVYDAVAATCSATGDWSPFADQFVEDVVYHEHAYGTMHGRETIRAWIVDVMAPFPQMRFTHNWVAYDEDNGAVVMEINNTLAHPTDPAASFSFPNFTRIVYAGDGQWASEEDVYNPARDAPGAMAGWMAAGGKFLTKPKVEVKHA